MSDLLQDLDPAPALVRGDLVFLVIDPSGTPLDRKAAIEFLLANLPKLDDIVLQSEVNSVTFFQILDTDGGVPILNVDTVNERVGIGIAAAVEKLHVLGNIFAQGDFIIGTGNEIQSDGSAFFRIEFQVSNQLIIGAGNSVGQAIVFLGGSSTEFMRIDTNTGDVAIGTTGVPSAGGGKTLVFGDNAGDPTMAANTAGSYAKDVAGTVERFAIDEAGNAAQLTSHPEDAPAAFYLSVSEDEIPAFIRKSFNLYIGKFEWFRSDLPLRQYETFAAYNTRRGLVEGHPEFMVVCNWTECQQAQVDRSEAKHADWQARKDAAEAAGEPFNEPEPVIYIAQDPPQSLQDRGVTLKVGS